MPQAMPEAEKITWKSTELGNACHIIAQCCIAFMKGPRAPYPPKSHLALIFFVFA